MGEDASAVVAGLQNNLRKLRLEAGLSQQALANRASVSRQAYAALEAGTANPFNGTGPPTGTGAGNGCRIDILPAAGLARTGRGGTGRRRPATGVQLSNHPAGPGCTAWGRGCSPGR